MKEMIVSILKDNVDLKLKVALECTDSIETASVMVYKTLQQGGKILLFGNGGSAADAQHLSSEFVNRFGRERKAFPAVALTTDSSVITSIGNDTSFEDVFSRQIEALGNQSDVAVGITTSGKSKNIIKALDSAKKMGLKTISFCGEYTDNLEHISDCLIKIPSDSTPRIQEVHITVGHIICEIVETLFFSGNS